jgi:hypothetical protein
MVYAEGPNFRFDIADAIARCRVWRRQDLDSAQGARCAEDLANHARKLAAGAAGVARAMVLDLRDAPAVSGPRTLGALGELLKSWEDVRRPVAMVVGASPTQALQFRRLVAQNAPRLGATFTDLDSALAWVAEVRSARQR